MTPTGSVRIMGAGAVSGAGLDWRGLGRRLLRGQPTLAWSQQLATGFPKTLASEVSLVPEGRSPAERRARLLMSRSALLALLATDAALSSTGWLATASGVGFYLGVGASGGDVAQLEAMLAASIHEQRFSLESFGSAGLAAVNPLFAFQLMNNFTLCHGAIHAGTQGPNAAFFSRGGGTLLALAEALYAVEQGDCQRALAGAADSSLHPVTWAELLRQGYAEAGYVPAEAAALLALERNPETPGLARLEQCHHLGRPGRPLTEALAALTDEVQRVSLSGLVLAPWGSEPREQLNHWAARSFGELPRLDASLAFGDALAAAPALAWLCGLDLLVSEGWQRVLVLSASVDDTLGALVLARESTV